MNAMQKLLSEHNTILICIIYVAATMCYLFYKKIINILIIINTNTSSPLLEKLAHCFLVPLAHQSCVTINTPLTAIATGVQPSASLVCALPVTQHLVGYL
jgi:hypothetical protein